MLWLRHFPEIWKVLRELFDHVEIEGRVEHWVGGGGGRFSISYSVQHILYSKGRPTARRVYCCISVLRQATIDLKTRPIEGITLPRFIAYIYIFFFVAWTIGDYLIISLVECVV